MTKIFYGFELNQEEVELYEKDHYNRTFWTITGDLTTGAELVVRIFRIRKENSSLLEAAVASRPSSRSSLANQPASH